jgi:hypothetical protein
VAVECFCGCGRVLRGSDARISKKGERVTNLTGILERITLRTLEGDDPELAEARANVEHMINDGYLIRQQLAELAHRERSPHDFDRRGFKSWMKVSTSMAKGSFDYVRDEAQRQGIDVSEYGVK